jgi:predicted ATPase
LVEAKPRRAHYNQALALYDPAMRRSLAGRFGQDIRATVLSIRSTALWPLGYPEAALADVNNALQYAREIGHAPSLMYALAMTCGVLLLLRNYGAANAQADQLVALAEEKSASFWKVSGRLHQGRVLLLTGKASDAVDQLTSGIVAYRSTGATFNLPSSLSVLAKAHADLRQFDDAWHCINEAILVVEESNQRWLEAEVSHTAGEIALMAPQRDNVKAQAYFEHALAVARHQQAKSWELRVAMSMARLWRGQGKRDEARELLAPVYGWFTEGFDTLDLKEAKALLDELAA